jgi:hypothetical protein
LGGWDQGDHDWRPASISKITRAKWTGGGGAEAVEHLLGNSKALSSNLSAAKKKKKEESPLLNFMKNITKRSLQVKSIYPAFHFTCLCSLYFHF